jgi:predicted metalloprotease
MISTYKLVIYVLIILIILILYLGSYNIIEGNSCMNNSSTSSLLNIISCANNNINNINNNTFTDISSVCINNTNDTINNIVKAGGLGNQASNLYNSTGQLLSNAANARGLC